MSWVLCRMVWLGTCERLPLKEAFMNKGKFLLSLIAGFALGAIGAVSLAAQEAPAANGVSVRMVVTVEAHHGSDVPVLDAKDVMVREGKERDRVTGWVPAQGEH